jgi:amylosucrase
MLATGNTLVMMAAQEVLLQKPLHTSWITYIRSHDDIGLGYEDAMIQQAGFSSFEHRKFLQRYYSGEWSGSPAKGALFGVNYKTGDARISGTLASLCGLEKAVQEGNEDAISLTVQKILMMQAHSFFIGGLPMLFYGDEVGYTNDYTYLDDESKSYDNRWMHRPLIDWAKNQRREVKGTIEQQLFSGTQRLLKLRKNLSVVADLNNHHWLSPHNIHVAGFVRLHAGEPPLYCLFNFSEQPTYVTWYAIKEKGSNPEVLFDHWSEKQLKVGEDHEYLVLAPYQFYLMEQR